MAKVNAELFDDATDARGASANGTVTVATAANLNDKSFVLDLACGTGEVAAGIARHCGAGDTGDGRSPGSVADELAVRHPSRAAGMRATRPRALAQGEGGNVAAQGSV